MQSKYVALSSAEGVNRMKRHLVLQSCLLLLWALAAPVSCASAEMTVSEIPNGIRLSCGGKNTIKKTGASGIGETSMELQYKDENTGEYTCVADTTGDNEDHVEGEKIFIKFRSCDNCVEFDIASVVGLVAGDLVLTLVIGVAVYLVISQTFRLRPVMPTSNKKSSDRQHLVQNEGGNRSLNDHYQPLKSRQRDTYDVLTHRK